MIEAHVTYYAGLDLEFLHICLIEDLEAGFHLIRSKDSKSVEQVNGLIFVIYLICIRNIHHRPQSPAEGFSLPFPAVTVSFKHYVLGLGNKLAYDSHDSRRPVFSCGHQSIDFSTELI